MLQKASHWSVVVFLLCLSSAEHLYSSAPKVGSAHALMSSLTATTHPRPRSSGQDQHGAEHALFDFGPRELSEIYRKCKDLA